MESKSSPLPGRLAELRDQIKRGTYRVDSWNLAQLLLAHPDARADLGLPPLIAHRSRSNLSRKAS